MKKLYSTPALRLIDLTTEGVIAGSMNSGVTIDRNASSNEDNLLTNKQEPDLWGNESVWK